MPENAGPPYFYTFDELPAPMKGALLAVQNWFRPGLGPSDPTSGEKWGPPDLVRYWSEETAPGDFHEWSIFHSTERYLGMLVRHTYNVSNAQIIRQWYGAVNPVERIPVTPPTE